MKRLTPQEQAEYAKIEANAIDHMNQAYELAKEAARLVGWGEDVADPEVN